MSSTTVFQSSAQDINVWALTGTDTLGSRHPRVRLTSTRVDVTGVNGIGGYADPPATVPQKVGDVPLVDAFNNSFFGGAFGTVPDVQKEGGIATNDSGMKQVVYADGHLYGALTTAAANGGGVDGATGAGVVWFEVSPSVVHDKVQAGLVHAGVVAPQGQNLIFPSITVDSSGNGVIAATLVGPNDYPSAAVVPFSASGAGTPSVVMAGAGPQDGFTETFLGGGRPRWGDYSAGVADANGHLWVATEAIHQTCTYTDYQADLTCGGTRAPLGNWSTQITEITP